MSSPASGYTRLDPDKEYWIKRRINEYINKSSMNTIGGYEIMNA